MQLLHTKEELQEAVAKELKIPSKEFVTFRIARRSLDARRLKLAKICYMYTVDVELSKRAEEKALKRLAKNAKVSEVKQKEYHLPACGEVVLKHRPVVVGFGPAGMFAALNLARAGFRPIVVERGECVEKRSISVEEYWKSGVPKKDSNVSFGEGGAGTFSDGKLNTMVKDALGRNQEVMRTFVRHGADEEILYDYKPHIGTDRLIEVVAGIRKEIQSFGGEIFFGERLEKIYFDENRHIHSICVRNVDSDAVQEYACEVLVLAIGHSARDTFAMLHELGVPMEAKSFAVGLRVQHPQALIDVSQYGEEEAELLSPAPYKLTHQASTNRGVYSFCMCPGGHVVAASTEEHKMVVNGMSYHARDSKVANSAIIVTVHPDDFLCTGDESVLRGLTYQRMLEAKAYELGEGKIPVQLYGDYKENRLSAEYGSFLPKFKGETKFAALHTLFSEDIRASIVEGMENFHKKIKGFANADAVLAGVESRTSSPIQILRNEEHESTLCGLYPCGEGAGYAGGITSAAMDGMKVAESIIRKYAPNKKE